ncbi:MAG: restriction endonuclease [Oligoflexia bacterium]|nr:restriction endonuclease [Oligoflexia bacterium]
MQKIKEAQQILKALGLATKQQNEMSALTLLALANILPNGSWAKASKKSMGVSNDIMVFVSKIYKRRYAPNSRETFRRQVLHQFTQACLTAYNPDNPKLPVNSPNAHYALTDEALEAIRAFGKPQFNKLAAKFVKSLEKRAGQYEKKRNINRIPLVLEDGKTLTLSPGEHNEVEAAIVREFGPRFAKGSKLLYLGDTENKEIIFEKDTLKQLGCKIVAHGKFPDVILFDEKNKWLFLIEAVSSHGPMSQKRVNELKDIFSGSKLGLVFVSAFPNFTEFKRHANDIAWDTEVWLADAPDHLIHYNGDRFYGPR